MTGYYKDLIPISSLESGKFGKIGLPNSFEIFYGKSTEFSRLYWTSGPTWSSNRILSFQQLRTIFSLLLFFSYCSVVFYTRSVLCHFESFDCYAALKPLGEHSGASCRHSDVQFSYTFRLPLCKYRRILCIRKIVPRVKRSGDNQIKAARHSSR